MTGIGYSLTKHVTLIWHSSVNWLKFVPIWLAHLYVYIDMKRWAEHEEKVGACVRTIDEAKYGHITNMACEGMLLIKINSISERLC